MSKFAGYFSDSTLNGNLSGGEGYLADKEELLELLKKYNDNAFEKTTYFNNNVVEKTKAFDENVVAQKNTFNENAQNKLDEFNNSANLERITTLETQVEKLEKKVDQAENILPTQKTSGENVYIDNAVKYPLMGLSGEGKCEQVTTSGSNKFNFNVKQSLSYVVYNEDGTITINGNGGNYIDFEPFTIEAGKTYYQKIELVSGTITGGLDHSGIMSALNSNNTFMKLNTFYKVTPQENVELKRLWVHNNAVYNNAKLKIWFSETETDFEPYTGGEASPNPGYSQEIETIKTYNFLPKTTQPSQKINGIDFTVNEDGSVTANGTATASATFYLKNQTTLKPDTYNISSGLDGVSGVRFGVEINGVYYNTNTSRIEKFTSEASVASTYFQIDSGITVENLTLYPAISKGNSYAPYGSLLYKGTGKSKIDFANPTSVNTLTSSNFENNILSVNSTGGIYKYAQWDILDLLKNNTGKTLYFYFESADFSNGKNPCVQLLLNIDGTNSYPMLLNEKLILSSYSIPTNVDNINTAQLRVYCNNSTTEISTSITITKPMITIEESTDYEPYQETILPIDLQGNKLCKVGNVEEPEKYAVDKLLIDRKGNIAIEKNVGELIFNGSESCSLQSINDYGIANFYIKHNLTLKATELTKTISNYFIHAYTLIANTTIEGMYFQDKGVYFRIKSSTASTVEEFKNWLSEHNVEIYCKLATPEIIDLGKIENPEMFKGVNNIVVETNLGYMPIEIEYVEDLQKLKERIEKVEQAIVAIGGI